MPPSEIVSPYDDPSKPKTVIGVLASRDNKKANDTLADILTFLTRQEIARLHDFQFVITGGTHDRIFLGDAKNEILPLDDSVAKSLKTFCGVTDLPPAEDGGLIMLSYLITQRQCSLVWQLYAPAENHWLRPENQAFMRLCDHWHVKRLMNRGSILAWHDHEAEFDKDRNMQKPPLSLQLRPDEKVHGIEPTELWKLRDRTRLRERWNSKSSRGIPNWKGTEARFEEMTIALIAHDEMKGRMIDFAVDHESELSKFKTILATGTTGREVAAATTKRISDKMVRYHSGPKGGDIEIATEVLRGTCHVVIFFVDTMRPHPHIEDIRVVFQACMTNDHVVMITTELNAREFMTRVVRRRESLRLYPT